MHTNILNEKELHPNSVIKEYLTTELNKMATLFNKWVAICCLYYQYPLHWDVVGFGGDVEVELFAEANAYGEEVAVFWKEFIVVAFASA